MEIYSTNSYLATLARGDVDEGRVVVADFQRAGRGRLDRTWFSSPRASLLCSLLLRPSMGVDDLQLVVAASALSVRAALVRLCGVRPDLKWPNDLVVAQRKIAGVLAEVVVTDRGAAIVVGVGVNLNAHPDDVAATSVMAESGLTVAPRALLDIVLEELEWRRSQLDDADGRDRLRQEYRGALSTIGRRVRVELLDGDVVGDARGVDDRGRLLVTSEGVEHVFAVGDVVHVRASDGARP